MGANQGLAWSTTVIIKIDLVGPKQRGLAMGLNEAAGIGLMLLGNGFSLLISAMILLGLGTALV